MKRFVTLILMLTTLLTFTQKATAFAPLLESEMTVMLNCPMSTGLNTAQMEMSQADCTSDGMPHSMDCQNDCDFMTVNSVLHFIADDHAFNQTELQLTYQTGSSAAPYYLPESLYRPPLLG
ncbi:MAG: hypothetical protein ACJAZP_002270 [Psychromonas sp.]|jgi:hypothetical protein|uniref:hypothetical protein n=1 Tax=Psychromonas sp. TaxID=1884585 RepID=UPI0039E37FBE